jgi:hypothetical protein
MSELIDTRASDVPLPSPADPVSLSLNQQLDEALPNIVNRDTVLGLEGRGLDIDALDISFMWRSFQNDNTRFRIVTRTLRSEALSYTSEGIASEDIVAACATSAEVALCLIVSPPGRLEVTPRNSKQELPQLAKLLLASQIKDEPVPVVVPVCPDTNGYILSDGIGEIAPKGISYTAMLNQYLAKLGIASKTQIHVADVEGLDPVLLEHTGETIDSHFAKTTSTRLKAEDRVILGGHNEYITVGSMNDAFEDAGHSFLEVRQRAMAVIADSTDKRVKKVVAGLLAERIKLGNFDRFDDRERLDLVVTELASYAAYGTLIGGEAIILSPDAKSAVPAYHFLGNENGGGVSPVLYAP